MGMSLHFNVLHRIILVCSCLPFFFFVRMNNSLVLGYISLSDNYLSLLFIISGDGPLSTGRPFMAVWRWPKSFWREGLTPRSKETGYGERGLIMHNRKQ